MEAAAAQVSEKLAWDCEGAEFADLHHREREWLKLSSPLYTRAEVPLSKALNS